MRRLALLLAVLAALLAGCGGSRTHAHLWLTPGHAKHTYSACVSSDCGPWSVTMNWTLPPFPNTTGYWLFLNGVQVGSAASSPFTFYGWDCVTSNTLGVEAHDGSGNHGPLWTTSYTAPACPASSDPANFHVAQSAAGTADGSSCANAAAVSTLSTATHWTAGNVIGLCGTITSTITAQGSGVSGNPITVYWEPNASVQQPVCPGGGSNQWTNACFVMQNRSYITLNGGANGSILSTANGTGLANQINAATGIDAENCTGCTVENLNISDMYQEQAGSNDCTSSNNPGMWISGSSITVANNTFNQDNTGINLAYMSNTNGQVSIHDNTFSSQGTGMTWIGNQTGGSIGPIFFYNNTMSGFSTWDTASDCYHRDGIHCFQTPAGTTQPHYSNVYMYDNRFSDMSGPTGQGYIFLEGGGGTATTCADNTSDFWIFNNTFQSAAGISNAPLLITAGRDHVYNNTFVNGATTNGSCVDYNQNVAGNADFENNLLQGCGGLVYDDASHPFNLIDYNAYSNGAYWRWGASTLNYPGSLATWATDVGGESHSFTTSNTMLNSDLSPQAGSPVLSTGTNLTSLCTGSLTPLCTEISGTARPSTGAWDVGAY